MRHERRVAELVHGIDVCSGLDEQLHRACGGCDVQGSSTGLIRVVYIGAGLDEGIYAFGRVCGEVERG